MGQRNVSGTFKLGQLKRMQSGRESYHKWFMGVQFNNGLIICMDNIKLIHIMFNIVTPEQHLSTYRSMGVKLGEVNQSAGRLSPTNG